MIKEFKKFIARGNVLDLAVGIIIGGAFTAIVASLVNDILTPLIGIVLGGIDFAGLSVKVLDATIMYGSFLQAIINFLLVAISVFILVKVINNIRKKQETISAVPTTKNCPYCLSEIAKEATRCAHCTSELNK
jgi:large conductance mechanosensitive channel